MDNNVKTDILKNFDGILLINKTPGITSYDVIRKLKGVFF